LKTVSRVKSMGREDTYELHLMLDTEHLMLLVMAGDGAIRKHRDLLEARDPGRITFRDLVGEGTVDIGSRCRKDVSLVEVDADADVLAGADDRVDAAGATTVLVVTRELR
jgi:hypothetical protein